MIQFKKFVKLREWLDAQRQKQVTIGFAPTMGALHEGHLSLIQKSINETGVTVCSIFINPKQFNQQSDFDKYPVTIEMDILLLLKAGTDILYMPALEDIYPEPTTTKNYDLGYIETILEGKFRPGHFQGVCMVVDRLLQIIEPTHLYLGQKDYQQCLVISRLLDILGKTGKIKVEICPTLREPGGLAMSSRNMRLTAGQKQQANVIYHTLLYIKSSLQPGNLNEIKQKGISLLENAGLKPDYLAFADVNDLSLIDAWDGKEKIVALIAAFVNEVRLIDNIIIDSKNGYLS